MTDIHWGRKANSTTHNDDCLEYIDWFCDNVRNDSSIDYVGFLGDWHENRSALNIQTLNASYLGAKKLNELGLPVFFVVGNHDLYHRHTREIYSVIPFHEFSNFVVIDKPTIIKEIEDQALFCPFLFHDEYPGLTRYNNIPFWAGHFEFRGFVVTGNTIRMPVGPNPENFSIPKRIVSGHFHKRQQYNNITYMGNTFPMDFGDAGDIERGMMTYDHTTDEMKFIDWEDCPRYIKIKLSDFIDNKTSFHPKTQIKCIVDISISYEESAYLKEKITKKHKVRDFTLEESYELKNVLSETEYELDWDETLETVDELVIKMLNEINTDKINNEKLVEIYRSLNIK